MSNKDILLKLAAQANTIYKNQSQNKVYVRHS